MIATKALTLGSWCFSSVPWILIHRPQRGHAWQSRVAVAEERGSPLPWGRGPKMMRPEECAALEPSAQDPLLMANDGHVI